MLALAPGLIEEAHITTNGASSGQCYQIFGLDVIIDKDLFPWLLEVCRRDNVCTDDVISS